ncbi:MAG: chemotaxis response regulator protein-glutamate methylesterase [Gammaproteobacteria bacterium]|nr:MAG: chemotaxis response regulator protein-glutamate methylesterase [Gammaproteobacteria bacterium]
MTVRVLVVDDSGFFRRRVAEILKPVAEIEVVGAACNGREAVELVPQLRPDVITMDYEMPVMDGITAVRQIMASNPTPVLMFSSLTHEGARVTLDALEAGAVDFLPKNFEDISRDGHKLQKILKKRIIDVAQSRGKLGSLCPPIAKSSASALRVPASSAFFARSSATAPSKKKEFTIDRQNLERPTRPKEAAPSGQKVKPKSYSCVLIGASTGGPVALQKVLTRLKPDFPAPILLVQHMPASFTPAFAERLNKICQITVKEAEDGDRLQKGLSLLAPGGEQMMLDSHGRVRILPGDSRVNYKPCVDVTFGSAARLMPGKTLGIILTGMGADGKEGCRMMKQTGSAVWSQDEKSSVIYGMPMAVAKAGYTDMVMNLDDIGDNLAKGVI